MATLRDIFGNIPLQSIARGAGAVGGTFATNSAIKKALDAIPTSPPDVTTPLGTATFSKQNNQITGEMSPELQNLFNRTSALTEGIGPAPTTYEEDLALARGDFDTRTARAIERLRDEQTRQGRFGTEAGARELGELSRVIEQQEQQLQENVRDRRHRERVELFGQATSGIELQDRLLGRPLKVIEEGTRASNQQLALAKEIAAAELAKGQGINNIIDGLLGGTGKDSLFGGSTVGSLLDKILGTGDAISKGSTLFDAADQIEEMRAAAEAVDAAKLFGGGSAAVRAAAGKALPGTLGTDFAGAASPLTLAGGLGGSTLAGTTSPVVDTNVFAGTPLTGVSPGFGSGMHPGGPGPAGLEAAKAAMDNYYPSSQPTYMGAGDATGGPGLFDPAKAFVKGIEQSLLNAFPLGTAGGAGPAASTSAGIVPLGGGTLAGTFGPFMAAITAIQAMNAYTDNILTMEDAVDAAKAYDPRILDLKAGKKVCLLYTSDAADE